MPIVDVELVSTAKGTPTAGLAQTLADALGRALNSPPGETWVRLRPLAREHYAENESILEPSELPVFVTVLRRTLPEKAALADEIAEVTRSVARVTERDLACVHVEYAPAAAGRLSFGGRLVE